MRQKRCPYCEVYRRTDQGLVEHVQTCEAQALEKDRADEASLRGEREHVEHYKQSRDVVTALPTVKVVRR